MTDPAQMLNEFPDRPSQVVPFDHDAACGLIVKWMRKGVGFGEITIRCDKRTGEWTVDTETMGPEFVGQVLMALQS